MLLLEKVEQKRKNMISIVVICVICAIIFSLFVTPKKTTAESTLMLVKEHENEESEFTSIGNIELTKKMISNFEEIIKSESSITLLNESLNTNITELEKQIQVKGNSDSDTFKIVVENKDLNLAKKINNELINIFSEKLKTIYSNIGVYIVNNAHIEEKINYSLIVTLMIISIISGVLINVIYIIVLVQVDKKVRKSSDLESELALKNLGEIPLNKRKNKLIGEDDKTAFAIAFRNLRSNIQFINVNNKEKNTILVTSPRKSEGKTIISANLAISFAKTGKKVILIDSDMISGDIDKIFNIPNGLGLSNYLSGIDDNGVQVNERINKFIKDTTINNLNVITSGTIPPNSSELLSMPKFDEMIKDLTIFYDILIFDGTQILNATDGLILTRLANSTLIVSNYKKTKKDDLYNAKRDIQNVGGKIIGIITNKVKVKEENEKIYIKAKKILKEKYLKIKEYIIIKIQNRKQKLLNAAIIEEKQKNIEELKKEENKFLEEIKKENEKEENTKLNIFSSIDLNASQFKKENSIKTEEDKESKDENKKEDIKEEKIEDTQEVEIKKGNEFFSNEYKNKQIILDEKSDIHIENKDIFKFIIAKEKIVLAGKIIKEKSLILLSIFKRLIKKVIDKIKLLKKQVEDREKVKKEIVQEKSNEIIKDNIEKKYSENTKNNQVQIDENKDENAVLVIIDAESGYCRAFSKYCFTERLIRGIDKSDGFIKANYSTSYINRKASVLMAKYDLTRKQVKRIDPLVYDVLQQYDDCIWIERKTTSNKAEDYVLCMAKDYEKNTSETKINYELRCQYLRKVELVKANIEIEYKLDNVWSSKQINFTDKIVFFRFAKIYENLKKRKKAEQRKNNLKKNNNILIGIKLKKHINLLNKIKFDQVKAKSIEELTREITESQNNFENYKFEDYMKYEDISKQDLDEQIIKQDERDMLKEQVRLNQEIKENKTQEKIQKREEKNRIKAEKRKDKELKKQKAKQEARIKEELLEDNLYPKTKYNKNL